MEGLKIPIGAPIQALTKDLNAAKAQVKSFVGYTDAELLKSSRAQYGASRKVIQVNEQLAESAALAAKAQRTQAAATAASGGALTNLGGGLTKALSGLRTLAYILPGIGIAGIFNLAFEALGPLIDGLEIFNKKVNDGAAKYNSLRDAIASGNQEAAKEITTLRLLYEASTNLQNPNETRIKAAKELIRLFPETFKAGSEEAIMNGNLGKSYQDLTKDIIANARAKAIAGKIAEEEAKILDAQIKRQKTVNANINENAKIKDVRVDIGMGQSYIYSQEQQINANNKRTKEELANIDKIVKKAQDTQTFLQQFVGDKTLVNALVGDDKAVEKQIKIGLLNPTKEWFALMRSKVKINVDTSDLVTATNQPANILSGNQTNGLSQNKKQTIPLLESLTANFQANSPAFLDALTTFNGEVTNLINNGLVGAFVGLGDAIGTALANGTSVLGSVGISLLSTLGSVLGQLGQMAIAAGVAVLGIKKALETLNPYAAIGAGIALLAVSGVVKGKLNKMGSSMGSSGSSGGNISMPGQSISSSTSSFTNSGDFSGGRVVFEISGVNLVGVLNRAGQKLARYGTI